jgi:hypothetical protein
MNQRFHYPSARLAIHTAIVDLLSLLARAGLIITACSSADHQSVKSVPAAGTELAVKAKRQGCCQPGSPAQAQRRHYLPRYRSTRCEIESYFASHSSHLFLLARGQGDFPPAAALVRRITSLMQEQQATNQSHRLLVGCHVV